MYDCFTIRFGKTFVDFSIAEAVPNLKYVWLVTDCELPWLIDKKGWSNTRIVFEIYQENKQTKIVFTHIGLVPGIECYENCVKVWTRFVTIILPKFLDEGQGLPE